MTEIEPYGDALLEMRDVSRSFGETHALTKATLDVRRGQVHALAGENGSGKSTLMKILAGVLRPDSGTIRWKGAETRFGRPRDARVEGISMVFQETLVVPYQSVQDNVVIGLDGIFRHSMDRRTESERARTALDVLGLDHIPLHRLVAELSLAERQLVTVARAIVTPWDLLVLDESTSALDAGARDVLFDYIRAQCAQGRAVLFTSHRMDEVEEIATTTTVLRLGRTVAERPMADTAPEQLLRLMAGQASGEDVVPRAQRAATSRSAADEPVLRAVDLSLVDGRRPASLDVRPGEIVGVAGLEGQGQVEFAATLCGLRAPVAGHVEVRDDSGRWTQVRGFSSANRHGIAFVPRDRRNDGLFGPLSIVDNFGFGLYRSQQRLGFIRRGAIRRSFEDFASTVRLHYGAAGDAIGTLSGGNQQKVLLARWIATQPRVLVLNDPFRGVDQNTKRELYDLLRDLADQGMAIVLVSTDLLEILQLSGTTVVFHEQAVQLVAETRSLTEADIVDGMFGGSHQQKEASR